MVSVYICVESVSVEEKPNIKSASDLVKQLFQITNNAHIKHP